MTYPKAGGAPGFPEEGTPQEGTPQDGLISLLLANIALDGIEVISGVFKQNRKGQPIYDHKDIYYKDDYRNDYRDDIIFLLKPEDDADEILPQVEQRLDAVGLSLNKAKSGLVTSTEKFNFLGWHCKVKANGNFKAFPKKVKTMVNCSNYGAKIKADKLAQLIRGWK